MEIWFIAAVVGAVFAGFSNFCFKIASKRGYNSELFTLIGGLVSVLAVSMYVLWSAETLLGYGWVAPLTILAGVIAASGGIMKVYALHNIDTTLFFPLFKLLSPLLALVIGIVFFGEIHSVVEWVGLIIGLTVPLLLINKIEHSRQNNLLLGLLFVLAISVTSAVAATLNKVAIDFLMPNSVTLWYASVGVAIGSAVISLYKVNFDIGKIFTRDKISIGLIWYSALRSLLICLSLGLILFAYIDGTLGVVQTIHSMYILIPIIFSIIFYKEHWNLQKVVAIVLSVASLALLG